jgi:anti-anti-sigma factor
MQVTIDKREGFVVLKLKGRSDVATSNMLEEKLLALVGDGEKHFVVELSNVEYISGAGLRMLLLVAKKLRSANGKIVLFALKGQVKEVFDMAGFSTIFFICRSLEEAIYALS